MVRTLPSNAGGESSIPDQAAKTSHVLQTKTHNIKQKQYYNKFSKDFQNCPHQKILKEKTAKKKTPCCLLWFIHIVL